MGLIGKIIQGGGKLINKVVQRVKENKANREAVYTLQENILPRAQSTGKQDLAMTVRNVPVWVWVILGGVVLLLGFKMFKR